VIRVRLLERPNCGLCEDALASLRRLSRRKRLDIERVDVTQDLATFDRYVVRVPVLMVGDAELEAGGMDEAVIGRWLDEIAP